MAYTKEWKNHKYIRKEGNRYIYPEDLKRSSTVRSNFRGSDQEFAKRQGAYSVQMMRREKAQLAAPGSVNYRGQSMTPSEYRSQVSKSTKPSGIKYTNPTQVKAKSTMSSTATNTTTESTDDKDKKTKKKSANGSTRKGSSRAASASSESKASSSKSSSGSSKKSSATGVSHGKIVLKAESAKPLHIRNRGGAVRGQTARQHATYSASQVAAASRAQMAKEEAERNARDSEETKRTTEETIKKVTEVGKKVLSILGKSKNSSDNQQAVQNGAKVVSKLFRKALAIK